MTPKYTIGRNLNKGIFSIRGHKGINVCIANVKGNRQSKERFNYADVESLECILYFQDKESIERVIDILQKVAEDMR